jgi:hypothetical protein
MKMARFFLFLTIILCTLPVLSPIASPVDAESIIRHKNETIASLLQSGDMKQAIAYLHDHISEDATFNIRYHNPFLPAGQQNSIVMDKKDYINSFVEGLRYVDEYNVAIRTESISESATGFTAREVMTEEGIMRNPQDMSQGIPFLSETTCQTEYSLAPAGEIRSEQSACTTRVGEISAI